jgi:hypothetical protein
MKVDRIAMPKLDIPTQVNSTSTGTINVFASDLFDFNDKGLKKNKRAKLFHGFAGTDCWI